MSHAIPFASIRSAASIGTIAARHLDTLWRAMMGPQGGVGDERWFRIVSGEPHPLGNVVVVLDGNDPDETAAAATPLLSLDVPSAVMFPHGVGDEVAGVLADRGFHAHGAMPAMAVDIERLSPTVLPAGHAWERIDAGDAEVQYFGIRHDGRLVCTSLLFLADGVAGIYCVATLPEARGRGLGAHATAEPLRIAHRLGYGVGVLQSSESGHGVYRRLGFEDVAEIPLFIRMP